MNTNSAMDAMTGRSARLVAHRLAWLVLFIGSTLPLLAAADTAYYVGNTTDVKGGTANCATSGNTTCSLRDAVDAINAGGAGTYNVYLPEGTIKTAATSDEDNNVSGDYDLKSLTVQTVNFIGKGSSKTIIDGDNRDRIFHTKQASIALTFSDLTLQNGNATGDGGCVHLAGTSLSLTNTVVTGCKVAVGGFGTGRGGGVYINLAGVITITNSTFSSNSAANTGGAVHSPGSVSINNSTTVAMEFSGNTAGSHGGAIYARYWLISGGSGSISFTSNSSTSGSGGAVYAGYGLDITNASFGGSDATAANHTDSASGNGGAIYVNGEAGAISSLRNSTVTYNTANNRGGGVYSETNGALNIDKCTISNNTSASFGGGVYSGSLTISNTLGTTYIESNTSGNSGGGVYVTSSSDTAYITGAVIKNNKGPDVSGTITNPRGGGFSTNGTATIVNSEITDNVIGGEGGGVAAVGVLTISGSTIARNQSTGLTGGGIYGSTTINITDSTIDSNTSKGNGGGLAPSGTTTLTRTTISNNTSQAGGGGLYTPGGTVNLYNSTVSGNQSKTTGGGIYTKYCSIINSTIYGNSAADASTAGGVYKSVSCTYTNTITAGNTGGGAAVNCGGWGTLTSNGYNIESANTCGFASAGDQPNTDPKLNALANNGGPTKTHALQVGSPAIDKGNNAVCAAAPINNIDQRVWVRPIDGDATPGAVCDIGAYEYGSGVASLPDHIKITHDGYAMTCRPENVTITACANAACTELYTGGANVTLTPGGQTFAIGSTGVNSAATVQQATTGTAILNAVSVPAVLSAASTECWNTTTRTASCSMVFGNSELIVTVPDHTSCNSVTATIKAEQNCTATFQNLTRSVKLYSTYVSPASGTQVITASTGVVSTVNTVAIPATTHTLVFDATGTATITTLTYPDAGQLMLTAIDTASGMTGRGFFKVAPASFAFSGIPAAPLTAGVTFNATVSAMNACATPAVTRNFNGVVNITSTNPQPGKGNATDIGYDLKDFGNGMSNASLTWDEVGMIDLNASMSTYLEWGLSPAVTGAQAGVGRFRPAYFDALVTPGCGAFTYAGSTSAVSPKIGQPFTVTVKAKRFNGGATDATNTANYAGGYAYDTTLSNKDTGNTTGLAGNIIAAGNFTNGIGNANVTYQVDAPQILPFDLTLRATDADTSPNPTPVSSTGHAEEKTGIRSGRVKLSNAHGSELLRLPVPIALQYYTANGWLSNGDDTCSAFTPDNFAFSSPGKNLAACETAAMSVSGIRPNLTLNLAAPGSGNDGWTDLTLNLGAAAAGNTCTGKNAGTEFTGSATTANQPWLQFPWSGSTAVVNPSARATFGKYKGADELIYMRENY